VNVGGLDVNICMCLGPSLCKLDVSHTGDDGYCPKGFTHLTEGLRTHVEGMGADSSGRGYPMDSIRPIEDLTGHGEDGLRGPQGWGSHVWNRWVQLGLVCDQGLWVHVQ
jgi:hypothetical protein